jgi:gas vesicle protein
MTNEEVPMRDDQRTDQEGYAIGTFMIGLACGAAIGAAVGMLFAPKSGAETRQQLADQAEWLRQRASEQTDRLRRRATEMYGDASQAVNDVMARSREALDVGREAFNRSRPHNGSANDIGAPIA